MKSEYINHMKDILKEEYPLYEKSLNNPPYRGFRINPLKITEDSFFEETGWKKDKVPFSKYSYYFNENLTVGLSKEYLAGLIYMQEPSASFPVEVLDPKSKEVILDMCGAPGSKATQIAERMHHEGLFITNEIDSNRVQILKENIVRSGSSNTIILNASPIDIAETFPMFFDAILVDAPCSGEGMFRKEPKAIQEWSMEHVKSCANRQAHILESAYQALKPGGRLVYSTCTFNRYENEETVNAFLNEHKDMHVLPINHNVGHNGLPPIIEAKRIYPMDQGEGQFVCLMQKEGESTSSEYRLLKSDTIPNDLLQEIERNTENHFPYYYYYKNKLYGGTHPFLSVGKCKLIRHQCYIGEVKKGRFEYSHDYFMNAYPIFKSFIELSDEEISSFFHGEAIKYNIEKGIYPVGFHHHSIGFIKSDGQYLKNKFPKGLRIK